MTDFLSGGPIGGLIVLAISLAGIITILVKRVNGHTGKREREGPERRAGTAEVLAALQGVQNELVRVREGIGEVKDEIVDTRHSLRDAISPLVTQTALLLDRTGK